MYRRLEDAAGHEQDVIRFHWDVRSFRLKNFLQGDRRFRHSFRSSMDDTGAVHLRGFGGAPGQRDSLKHGKVPAIDQQAAWLLDISDYVDDVRLMNNDRITGRDSHITGWA